MILALWAKENGLKAVTVPVFPQSGKLIAQRAITVYDFDPFGQILRSKGPL